MVDTVRVGAAAFDVRYWPEDADAASQVRRALERAVPVAERWGRFSAPVVLTIHPTHRALEVAARHEGYAWLRAWARYDSVELQSPRTWSRGSASDGELTELLAHELTHCVMYQSSASEGTWSVRARTIPLWFREGMASVTAGQQHPRVSTAASGRAVRDPLAVTEAVYRLDATRVYATAHEAFRFLLERHGEEAVRRLIAAMGEGRPFADAFQWAVGVRVEEFEGEFRRQAAIDG